MLNAAKSRAHVIVSGSVQGVSFRSETRRLAQIRGVRGYVRNLPHGKVEAVFEGERECVIELVKFCHSGPEGAHVKDIQVDWEDFKGEYSDFRVLQ